MIPKFLFKELKEQFGSQQERESLGDTNLEMLKLDMYMEITSGQIYMFQELGENTMPELDIL